MLPMLWSTDAVTIHEDVRACCQHSARMPAAVLRQFCAQLLLQPFPAAAGAAAAAGRQFSCLQLAQCCRCIRLLLLLLLSLLLELGHDYVLLSLHCTFQDLPFLHLSLLLAFQSKQRGLRLLSLALLKSSPQLLDPLLERLNLQRVQHLQFALVHQLLLVLDGNYVGLALELSEQNTPNMLV
jgi:hypothetical protein